MSIAGQDYTRINCLFSAVEADPLIKVGGLGDVAFSLPNALRNLHPDEIGGKKIDVRLVLPCHAAACKGVKDTDFRLNFEVQTGLGSIPTTVFLSEIKGMPVYFNLFRFNPAKYTRLYLRCLPGRVEVPFFLPGCNAAGRSAGLGSGYSARE